MEDDLFAPAEPDRSNWVKRMLKRCHNKLVVVALADEIARAAWAVLAKGTAFEEVKWQSAKNTNS